MDHTHRPAVMHAARYHTRCPLCDVLLKPGLPIFGHQRGWTCYACHLADGAQPRQDQQSAGQWPDAVLQARFDEIERRVTGRPPVGDAAPVAHETTAPSTVRGARRQPRSRGERPAVGQAADHDGQHRNPVQCRRPAIYSMDTERAVMARLTSHARQRIRERSIPLAEVAATLQQPLASYPSRHWQIDKPVSIYDGERIRLIVAADLRVVTAMWRAVSPAHPHTDLSPIAPSDRSGE